MIKAALLKSNLRYIAKKEESSSRKVDFHYKSNATNLKSAANTVIVNNYVTSTDCSDGFTKASAVPNTTVDYAAAAIATIKKKIPKEQ